MKYLYILFNNDNLYELLKNEQAIREQKMWRMQQTIKTVENCHFWLLVWGQENAGG